MGLCRDELESEPTRLLIGRLARELSSLALKAEFDPNIIESGPWTRPCGNVTRRRPKFLHPSRRLDSEHGSEPQSTGRGRAVVQACLFNCYAMPVMRRLSGKNAIVGASAVAIVAVALLAAVCIGAQKNIRHGM
jgi:hypothetical protein